MKNIIMTGFMGTQKSMAGKLLAKRIGHQFVDMDEEIELQEQMKISQIFAGKGEEYFRRVETETAKRLGAMQGVVIATGGGVPMRQENMDYLGGTVVLLTCEADELFRRVGKDKTRPVVAELEKTEMKHLLEKRRPYYEKYAQIVVDTTKRSPEETAEEIYNRLMEADKR